MPANDRVITGFIKRGENWRHPSVEFQFLTMDTADGVAIQLKVGMFPDQETADRFVAKTIEQMQGFYAGGTVAAESAPYVVGETPSEQPAPARKAAGKPVAKKTVPKKTRK